MPKMLEFYLGLLVFRTGYDVVIVTEITKNTNIILVVVVIINGDHLGNEKSCQTQSKSSEIFLGLHRTLFRDAKSRTNSPGNKNLLEVREATCPFFDLIISRKFIPQRKNRMKIPQYGFKRGGRRGRGCVHSWLSQRGLFFFFFVDPPQMGMALDF